MKRKFTFSLLAILFLVGSQSARADIRDEIKAEISKITTQSKNFVENFTDFVTYTQNLLSEDRSLSEWIEKSRHNKAQSRIRMILDREYQEWVENHALIEGSPVPDEAVLGLLQFEWITHAENQTQIRNQATEFAIHHPESIAGKNNVSFYSLLEVEKIVVAFPFMKMQQRAKLLLPELLLGQRTPSLFTDVQLIQMISEAPYSSQQILEVRRLKETGQLRRRVMSGQNGVNTYPESVGNPSVSQRWAVSIQDFLAAKGDDYFSMNQTIRNSKLLKFEKVFINSLPLGNFYRVKLELWSRLDVPSNTFLEQNESQPLVHDYFHLLTDEADGHTFGQEFSEKNFFNFLLSFSTGVFANPQEFIQTLTSILKYLPSYTRQLNANMSPRALDLILMVWNRTFILLTKQLAEEAGGLSKPDIDFLKNQCVAYDSFFRRFYDWYILFDSSNARPEYFRYEVIQSILQFQSFLKEGYPMLYSFAFSQDISHTVNYPASGNTVLDGRPGGAIVENPDRIQVCNSEMHQKNVLDFLLDIQEQLGLPRWRN